ncbi:flagellar basal body rod C-terminal domain-containing protein [Alicyclobacillus ferrooxydans]|uniref:Uncharacterized protein n=1 Tax=Alicyclobacillus ferrooxydans TaxID=471514 RepID=A0A0P9D4K4_9BACL|nr:flagellar basal body rod C-terminal domain-containing protein [Alicyclobacillus ferrooxydans]KPV44391.1 hypothetical protein AN477_07115 [Alicyclobacillus ferrooxydans]
MLRGITTASSGMLTDQRLEQALANNLANLQTPGYKAVAGESLSFPQQLIVAMKDTGSSVIGQLGTGAVYQEGVPYFGQGAIASTGRNLDVAIQDNLQAGTYASVVGPNNQPISAQGQITSGLNGRLTMNGQPLAILNGQNQIVPNVYAAVNPAYKPANSTVGLVASDGKPNYDSAGNPSYVFVNAQGKIIGSSASSAFADLGIRVGNQNDMGVHQFFPVGYTAFNGNTGVVLTQDGHFSINAKHQLVDVNGNPILPIDSVTGRPIVGGHININPNYTGKALFASNGTALTDAQGQLSFQAVNATGQVISTGRLGTVGADVTNVSPLGQSEYMVNGTIQSGTALGGLTFYNSNNPNRASLLPGELEQSNVNQNQTMTEMDQILNEYQANQSVLQSEAQALDLATTDIGKVNI